MAAISKRFINYRNLTLQTGTYTGVAVAPHGNATRITYTVPAGKKATLGSAFMQLTRTGAASAASTAQMWVEINGVRHCLVQHRDNSTSPLANTVNKTYAPGLVLPAGTIITVHSQDASTGGDYSIIADLAVSEYDDF